MTSLLHFFAHEKVAGCQLYGASPCNRCYIVFVKTVLPLLVSFDTWLPSYTPLFMRKQQAVKHAYQTYAINDTPSVFVKNVLLPFVTSDSMQTCFHCLASGQLQTACSHNPECIQVSHPAGNQFYDLFMSIRASKRISLNKHFAATAQVLVLGSRHESYSFESVA